MMRGKIWMKEMCMDDTMSARRLIRVKGMRLNEGNECMEIYERG